jgi:hypothetical protein
LATGIGKVSVSWPDLLIACSRNFSFADGRPQAQARTYVAHEFLLSAEIGKGPSFRVCVRSGFVFCTMILTL